MNNPAIVRAYARRIVERDAHVSWSVRKCAYHVIRRTRVGRKGYRTLARPVRYALWAGARDGAMSNRKLYAFVQNPH